MSKHVKWAKEHPHTGSRKDYWPHIFNNVNEGIPGFAYQLRLNACQLRWGARRIYSPDLLSAWKNVNHQEAEKGDWFEDWQVVDYLIGDNETQINGEIKMNTVKHLKDLNLQPLQKKSFPSLIKEFGPTVFLAILLGTYLDLYFVGKKMYMFPMRPFPEVFSL